MGPRLRGDDDLLSLTPLQLEQAARLQVQLDVVGIDLVQRVAGAAVADLAGGELVDDAILRRACRRDRLDAIGRHAAASASKASVLVSGVFMAMPVATLSFNGRGRQNLAAAIHALSLIPAIQTVTFGLEEK